MTERSERPEAASLAALIERLEKATGPDRILDALIEIELRKFQAYAAGMNDEQRARWKVAGKKGEVEEGGTRYHAPEYTRFIDAARPLLPDPKIGWWSLEVTRAPDSPLRNLGGNSEIYLAKAAYWTTSGNEFIGRSDYPAIALCIAALCARESGGTRPMTVTRPAGCTDPS